MNYGIKNVVLDCQYIVDICKGAATPLSNYYKDIGNGVLAADSLIVELTDCLGEDVLEEEKY